MSDGPKREAEFAFVSRISGSGGFVTFQGGRARVCLELTLHGLLPFLVNGL